MVEWSLSKKFFALNIGMSLVTVAVVVMSFVGGGETQQKYEAVARGVLEDVISIDQAFLDFRETRIGLRTLGIAGVTSAQGAAAKQQVHAAISSVDLQLDKLDRPELSNEQKMLVSNLKKSWSAFKKTGSQIFELYDIGTPDSRSRLVGIFFKECPEAAAEFLSHAEKLRLLLASQQKVWVTDARQTAEFNNMILGVISVIGIILGLLLSTMITMRISNSLKKLITELNDGAKQVADAADQIAKTSSTLSRSAANQAGSLEESVASVEELTATVKLNTDNAKQASVLANSARDLATVGEGEMKSLIEVIQRISSDSKQIAEISSVIDDIAFQTNLLALNAAVEAARAGEQGKGFAVVADAVRSLAQRSADSAKNINSLIEDSVDRIDKGATQANHSGEVLNEIVNSIKKVSDLNHEIATASEEQSVGITQISRAMNQLDVVTQENAAASQDSATTAEELSAQSAMLLKSVTSLDNLASGG